jgi:predicted ATPase with chaperone activity
MPAQRLATLCRRWRTTGPLPDRINPTLEVPSLGAEALAMRKPRAMTGTEMAAGVMESRSRARARGRRKSQCTVRRMPRAPCRWRRR